MDLNRLFTEAGLRAWCDDRRDQHLEDARHYGQLADIFARHLQQYRIDGDRLFAARIRAHRVVRHLRKLERDSRHAAADAQSLCGAYVQQVLEVPARRKAAALKKAEAKDKRAQRKALRRSTAVLAAQHEQQTAQGYLTAQPKSSGEQQTATVLDFFKNQKEAG
jgi:hypothetical protein